jgi:hypothetical protein
MNFLNWFTNGFSDRRKAMSLYKRGMAKAKNLDRQGAITDYSAVVDMPHISEGLRAMALYNRALVHFADKDDPKAIHDLETVLEMKETLNSVRTAARQKLLRIERRSPRTGI